MKAMPLVGAWLSMLNQTPSSTLPRIDPWHGAGQMARVDAARIAVWKANEAGLTLKGSVVCSDAFFPLRTADPASEAGATAAINRGLGARRRSYSAAMNAKRRWSSPGAPFQVLREEFEKMAMIKLE
jgi:hypothetical protein